MKAKQIQILTLMTLMFLIIMQARAVDGVIEINHTCATQMGCFSGDSGGYPVSIDGSIGNSYKLTSDLIIPDSNTSGININSANIHLDLNGFSIIGINCLVVTDVSFHCRPPTGNGFGVFVTAAFYYGITIKNGSVIGMGNKGIFVTGYNSTVKNIHARWNRREGIEAIQHALLTGNTVFENGNNGIECSSDCLIRGNVSNKNLGDGINASIGSMITGNILSDNSGYGLNFSFAATSGSYRENVFRSNSQGTVNFGLDLGNNSCNTTTVCP